MYITKAEQDALYAAADFISNNSDGAQDQEYYADLQSKILSVWRKAICVNTYEEREALLKEMAEELNNAYSALLGLPKTEITDRIMSRLLPLINKSKQHTS